MNFDRWDICEAYYLFGLSSSVSGQHSYLDRLQAIGYKPRLLLTRDTLSEGARDIYDNLCEAAWERRLGQ